jgi:hypothetical protein
MTTAWVQSAVKQVSASSTTLAFGSNTTAGNSLFGIVTTNGARTITLSDSLYGSWNTDYNDGQPVTLAFFSKINLGSTSGTPPTVTINAGTTVQISVLICEFSGVLGAFDQSGHTAAPSSTSVLDVTSGALASPNELALACVYPGAGSPTGYSVNSPWTLDPNGHVGAFQTAYNIVSGSTAAQTATFNWTGSSNMQSAIATYTVAAALASGNGLEMLLGVGS